MTERIGKFEFTVLVILVTVLAFSTTLLLLSQLARIW